MSNNRNKEGATFLTFILGAAAGVAAGMLLAPTAGEEARKKLADQANKLKDQWGNKLSDLVNSAGSQVDKYVNKAEDYARQAERKVEITTEQGSSVDNENP